MKVYTQLGFIVLLLALMVIVPVVAQGPNEASMGTSVTLMKGDGAPPVVLAKWETDTTPYLEDADPLHNIQGSQFNPPGTVDGTKMLNYYAIVTDAQGPDVVTGVFAEVWHPDGKYKYQVHFEKLSKSEGQAELKKVLDPKTGKNLHLITDICDAQCGVSEAKTVTVEKCPNLPEDLAKDDARVWRGQALINYHQMDGNYQVDVYADVGNVRSESLWNTFYYAPLTAVEYDFQHVNYGDVLTGVNKWSRGNTLFANGDGFPTVRNIGNTKVKFIVNQNDMGFGNSYGAVPNVRFDARLGDTSQDVEYAPDTDFTLLDTLDRCNTNELDFSIHVIKKPQTPITDGTMILRVFDPEPPLESMTYCQWKNWMS